MTINAPLNVIAEARELLKNTEYQDGIATGLTQDHEALERALEQAAGADDHEKLREAIEASTGLGLDDFDALDGETLSELLDTGSVIVNLGDRHFVLALDVAEVDAAGIPLAVREDEPEGRDGDDRWTSDDSTRAVRQGWDLFESGGRYDIQMVDEGVDFTDDAHARDYVRERGGPAAEKALRLQGTPVK